MSEQKKLMHEVVLNQLEELFQHYREEHLYTIKRLLQILREGRLSPEHREQVIERLLGIHYKKGHPAETLAQDLKDEAMNLYRATMARLERAINPLENKYEIDVTAALDSLNYMRSWPGIVPDNLTDRTIGRLSRFKISLGQDSRLVGKLEEVIDILARRPLEGEDEIKEDSAKDK